MDEIKHKLQTAEVESVPEELRARLDELTVHFKKLERQCLELRPMLDQLKPHEAKSVSAYLSSSSSSYLNTLLMLVSEHPFL